MKAQRGTGSFGGKQPKLCPAILSWTHGARKLVRVRGEGVDKNRH